VSYAYGSTSGSVQGSGTIYVPIGTIVLLAESPASFLNAFVSWSGNASGTSGTASVKVNAPSSVIATFGYNYINISAIVGVVVVVAAAIVVGLRRRKP
jgi:beta-lactamase regulating signal transducer with metallopeptidase domain